MPEALKWIYGKTEKNFYRIVILSVLQSLFSLSGIIYAVLFRYLIDSAGKGSFTDIKKYSLYFLIVLFLHNLMNAVLRRLQEKVSIDIESSLKHTILKDIFERDYAYVSDVHSGEWMNKITSDISIVSYNMVHLLPNLCSVVIQIIAAVFVLTSLEPRFMLFLLIVLPLALIFEFFFYRYIKILHKQVQEKDGFLRVFLQECLNSLIVIKSYAKEGRLLDELYSYLQEYKNARLRKNQFSVVMNFFFGLGMNGMLIMCGIYCAYGIVKQSISYGTMVAILQIITQIRTPLASAYGNIPNYYALLGSAERLKEIEDFDLDRCDNDIEIGSFYENEFQSIKIDDLSFAYKDLNNQNRIIEAFSMCINKGEFIAVHGPSGCGKSTLFKLLLSLYKPIKGSIDVVSKENSVMLDSSYRTLFAYVPQNNQLMKGSIKDIICFSEDYDEYKMKDVLKISCCDEFASKFPAGIDTELKEKGNGLSEGQMQRIAIARALYSNHPILLLDEVTSSLNEELEIAILNNLKAMTNKTVLLITHHRNALKYVDQVIECKEKEGHYVWRIRKAAS